MLAVGSAPSNAASPQPELPVCKPVSQQSTLMWLKKSIMYNIWALSHKPLCAHLQTFGMYKKNQHVTYAEFASIHTTLFVVLNWHFF